MIRNEMLLIYFGDIYFLSQWTHFLRDSYKVALFEQDTSRPAPKSFKFTTISAALFSDVVQNNYKLIDIKVRIRFI